MGHEKHTKFHARFSTHTNARAAESVRGGEMCVVVFYRSPKPKSAHRMMRVAIDFPTIRAAGMRCGSWNGGGRLHPGYTDTID